MDDGILDNEVLDEDTTIVPSTLETPNTFGRNLLRRLGIAKEAEAVGSSSNNTNINKLQRGAFNKTSRIRKLRLGSPLNFQNRRKT